MFSRKLRALNYHSPDEDILLDKTEELKPLVVWLEDRKIRFYKIEERGALREGEGWEWVAAFKKYLKVLECPYTVEADLPAAVDWLLGVAVRYEFGEIAESNPDIKRGMDLGKNGHTGGGGSARGEGPLLPKTNRKNSLDFDPSDPTFVSGTQALAKILKITLHPDPSVLLEAIRIIIEEKLSESALSEVSKSKSIEKSQNSAAKMYGITAKECGFDLGDPVLSEAAKTLRLLHIQELRHLQTRINELIVAVQAITANPKTDQSLGKVGR